MSYYSNCPEEGNNSTNTPFISPRLRKIIIAAVVATALIIVLFNSFATVGPTERGIKLTFGSASDEILQPGLHAKTPFVQSVRKYSLEPVVYTIEFSIGTDSAITSDMQSVGLTASVIWTYNENLLYDVATKYTTSSLRAAISTSMLASIKESVGKYTIYEIVENQEKISQEIQSALITKMDAYPIIISQVAISNWDWSAEFDAAISETMQINQENKKALANKEKVETETQTRILKAEGDQKEAKILAETNKLTAEINAEATKIEADALAYKYEKIEEHLDAYRTMTELENQAAEISKWNGQYVSTYQYGTIPITTGSLLGPSDN